MGGERRVTVLVVLLAALVLELLVTNERNREFVRSIADE